jgi:23S rRNA (pseudouridine1915-N3)-methyltransferase
MKLRLIVVGQMTTPGIKVLAQDYQERLLHYTSLDIIEVKEAKGTTEEVLAAESMAIQKHIPASAIVYVLAVEGSMVSSLELASLIEDHQTYASTPLVFIIGGSDGLAASVKQRGTLLSVSPMTFPHQLMRVLLLEQLYRAFKILRHEVYHK